MPDPKRPSIGRISLAPSPRSLAHAPAGSGRYSMRPPQGGGDEPSSADLLPTDRASPADNRRFVLQALLLEALG